MKTSLEIPDELVRSIKVLAANEGKKLKDIIAESLFEHLKNRGVRGHSLLEIEPVSLGKIYPVDAGADTLEDMLDGRGHRY